MNKKPIISIHKSYTNTEGATISEPIHAYIVVTDICSSDGLTGYVAVKQYFYADEMDALIKPDKNSLLLSLVNYNTPKEMKKGEIRLEGLTRNQCDEIDYSALVDGTTTAEEFLLCRYCEIISALNEDCQVDVRYLYYDPSDPEYTPLDCYVDSYPESPQTGDKIFWQEDFYFNNENNTVKEYNGSEWVDEV